jgi:hypothetical protein
MNGVDFSEVATTKLHSNPITREKQVANTLASLRSGNLSRSDSLNLG